MKPHIGVAPVALAITMFWSGAIPAAECRAIDNDSALTFTAVQQDAEFDGRFERFSARVSFDPEAPESGHISATIELDSINTLNTERDEYVRGEDWLHISHWPTAEYSSQAINKEADGNFVAKGALTLRGISQPVNMKFTFSNDNGQRGSLVGDATIQRLDFGVGQGDWTDTRWVGNSIHIHIDLSLDCQRPD